MPIRSFTTVPENVRDWGSFFRETTVTADIVAPGTVDTPMIVDKAVTNAKLRDSAALTVIGRSVNSAGVPSDIGAANDGEVLRRAGTTLLFGTLATAGIANDAITDAKLRDSAALSVVGRATNSVGDPADIAAANDGEVLRRSGATLGFGTLSTAGIANDAVTNALLADMAQDTIKGRTSGSGTGDPVDLTAAQVAAIISSAIASALNIASGTYTPTLTNVSNVTGSTAYQCQYLRVGSMVVVSGKVDVDPTAAAASQLGISLPIASNLGAGEDCAGTAFAPNVAGQGAAILADAANNRASMQWVAVDTSNQDWYFSFSYEII